MLAKARTSGLPSNSTTVVTITILQAPLAKATSTMAAATSGLGWWAQARVVGIIPFAVGYEFICRRYRVPDTPNFIYVIDDFEGTLVGRAGFPGSDLLMRVDDYVKWMDVRVQREKRMVTVRIRGLLHAMIIVYEE